VIFEKNSDRPRGERQSIRRYPAERRHGDADHTVVCTYISIPQSKERTHAVLLSQIDWMFGAEMGANEAGVVIGNEAVWTKEPDRSETDSLLGMDLVRLGLERGDSARGALHVITSLLQEHGQGGPCAENDPSFTYHNSFLITDCREAYVLETAGKHWVAERVTSGVRNISNNLTIRTKFDLHSEGLHEHAKSRGLWDGSGELDFTQCFSEGGPELSPYSRQVMGTCLLQEHKQGALNAQAMMDILKDHESGICMHGSFETAASMVSELKANSSRHWMTGKAHPCKNPFELQSLVS
jgi:secernin